MLRITTKQLHKPAFPSIGLAALRRGTSKRSQLNSQPITGAEDDPIIEDVNKQMLQDVETQFKEVQVCSLQARQICGYCGIAAGGK